MISILFFTIFLLLSCWVIGLPLLRKRPVVITKKIILASFVLLFYYSPFAQNIALVATSLIVIGLLVIIPIDLWLLIGITKDDTTNALQRAMTGLQLQFVTEQNRIVSREPEGNITLLKLLGITGCIVVFRHHRSSKKYRLLKKVFRKFIDNYNFRT